MCQSCDDLVAEGYDSGTSEFWKNYRQMHGEEAYEDLVQAHEDQERDFGPSLEDQFPEQMRLMREG